jgi:uncharacterized protein YcfL
MKKVFTLAFAVAMMSLAACSGEKKAETSADSTVVVDSTTMAPADTAAVDSTMAPADTTKK